MTDKERDEKIQTARALLADGLYLSFWRHAMESGLVTTQKIGEWKLPEGGRPK